MGIRFLPEKSSSLRAGLAQSTMQFVRVKAAIAIP